MPQTLTAKFVILTGIIYLIDVMVEHKLLINCAFITESVHDFEIWRIFTAFFFFNPGTNLIFALVILFVFYSLGHSIEKELGSKRFLNMLICTSAGMALIGLITPVAMGYIDGMLSGLFLAYGLFLGKEKMTLLLFFLMPLTLSGYMLIGFTVGIIFASALIFSSSVALPMLGGCFGSYFYINMYMKGKDINLFGFLKPKQKTKQAPKRNIPAPPPMNSNQRNFSVVEDEPEEEMDDVDRYITEKVDPILEKIANSGMSSLTSKEKKILEDAKKKMGK